MWSIQTRKYYYSAFEKEGILESAITWINLEDFMPSEISQSQKDRYCTIPSGGGTRNRQSHGERQWRSGYQIWGKGEWTVVV